VRQILDIVDEPGLFDGFVLAAHAATASERNRLARSSDLVRLAPGVYVSRGVIPHRVRVAARALIAPGLVFSHDSAAALWRLPRISAWPERTHVIAERATGGRSTPGVVHHRLGLPDQAVVIDGITVTTLPRTVVDIARTHPLDEALVAADAALSGVRLGGRSHATSRDELAASIPRAGRGRAAARFITAFADGRSGSPGESLSRLTMHRAGLTPPVLQYRLDDAEGAMFADFAWPDRRVIGEFDGVAKYVRDEFAAGRDPAQVVVDEKWREDRIRALGWRVARWGWDVARSVPRLRERLVRAGVR
jgi:hypothetical protein